MTESSDAVLQSLSARQSTLLHGRPRGRKIAGSTAAPAGATASNHPEENSLTKGYWIARVDVSDAEAYKTYVAANAAPIAKFGGRFLVRAGRFENPEGTSRGRNVVIEFASYQAALDCYRSPEYTAAIRLRLPPVASVDMVVIEGYDGPQPG
jgi:uncharacterized protein (DUF1330 family)